MKTGIYDALAQVNRGFEQAIAGLKTLQENGVLAPEYIQNQQVLAGELWAGINTMILDRLKKTRR